MRHAEEAASSPARVRVAPPERRAQQTERLAGTCASEGRNEGRSRVRRRDSPLPLRAKNLSFSGADRWRRSEVTARGDAGREDDRADSRAHRTCGTLQERVATGRERLEHLLHHRELAVVGGVREIHIVLLPADSQGVLRHGAGSSPRQHAPAADTPAYRARRPRVDVARGVSAAFTRTELCRDLTSESLSVPRTTRTERRSSDVSKEVEFEALADDRPTPRVLDAGGMARPGVIHDRDETPAASVSGSSFSIGLAPDAASSPDPEAMFVVCHELLGRLRRRAPRQTLLYVDVNGVALVDAKTKRCVSRAAFNELTSWCAVDAHVFELKQLGVETRKLESRRFEMTRGVAAELCAALRSRVRLYVERPDEVRRLRATAAGFRAGDRVCRETLARARALGDGGGETAFRGEAVASASRYEKTPSAKFRLESVNSEVLRVASATPGERLARAGARRRLPRARDPSQVREVPRDAPATETSSGDSPGGGFGFFGFGDERTVGEGDASTGAAGTFVDGVGLDDASLRAAYARREAAYAKLREEEDAAWAASRIERSESESESDGDDAFSFGEKNVELKNPS